LFYFLSLRTDVEFSNEEETNRTDEARTNSSTSLKQPPVEAIIDTFNKNRVCLFDLLKIVLSRKCSLTAAADDWAAAICCEQEGFPFDSKILEFCMKNSSFLTKYVSLYQNLLYETLYYNKTNGLVSVVEFKQITSFAWTASFEKMAQFYKSVERFFDKSTQFSIVDQQQEGPSAEQRNNLAKNAFFVSEFDFYDLQKNLLNGTLQSFFITLGVVSFMMLIMTRNLLITFYAVITITMSISTTVGTLALLGWQLNIVESVSIILAIGLSIDFVVHFSITYCNLSTCNLCVDGVTTMFFTRDNITKQTIRHVGSAVFMAGVTTLLAGISMRPSPLLPFQIYGIFLVTVIVYSIIYSFFFFLPICAIAGPTNNFCQIRFSKKQTKYTSNDKLGSAPNNKKHVRDINDSLTTNF
jgi:protein dispatched 1